MIYYRGKKLCNLLQIDTILPDNIIAPSCVTGGVYNATCDILPDNIIFYPLLLRQPTEQHVQNAAILTDNIISPLSRTEGLCRAESWTE